MTATPGNAPCPKCDGRGEIAMFRHVRGGACFTCKGRGQVKAGAAPLGKKWICVYGGKELFCRKARTEAEAYRQALAHFRKHGELPAFEGLTEADVSVKPFE